MPFQVVEYDMWVMRDVGVRSHIEIVLFEEYALLIHHVEAGILFHVLY